MKSYQITTWTAHFIQHQVRPGDLTIDATMGNGHDTLLLSNLCGPDGSVLAFDIQPQALAITKERLQSANAPKNYTLIQDSHANLTTYASPNTVSCIVFNLGYLPGGDHSLSTSPKTTLPALEQSLTLLKTGGLLSLCIYSGGDSGFEERDCVLSWLKNLDSRKYLVIKSDYYNRPNNPPIPVLVIKL